MDIKLFEGFGLVLLVIGTFWQMVLAAHTGVKQLADFQPALNEIVNEEIKVKLRDIPKWRARKRRKAIKSVVKDAKTLLIIDEYQRSKLYDRQAYGWLALMCGSVLAAIAGLTEGNSALWALTG